MRRPIMTIPIHIKYSVFYLFEYYGFAISNYYFMRRPSEFSILNKTLWYNTANHKDEYKH